MYQKKFAINQKVSFLTRDHGKKEFISGHGTVKEITEDHFGDVYVKVKQVVELEDGKKEVRFHIVPINMLDASEKNREKFKKWIVRYEEADEKFRKTERERFEKLTASIFTKVVERKIAAHKVSQGKAVAKANKVLATLRKYAIGAPSKEFSDYPQDVVEAAIDGEVREVVKEKVVDQLNKI